MALDSLSFMNSLQQNAPNSRRGFFLLCYIFRSLCCCRCHPESRAVQLRVILACVFYLLTDHVTSGVFQRGHKSSLSCRAVFTRSYTMHDTSKHHVICPIFTDNCSWILKRQRRNHLLLFGIYTKTCTRREHTDQQSIKEIHHIAMKKCRPGYMSQIIIIYNVSIFKHIW